MRGCASRRAPLLWIWPTSPPGDSTASGSSGWQPWDMAAGVLLIREAGGLATDPDGDEHYLESGNIVTGTPKVLRELVKVITPIWQARKR